MAFNLPDFLGKSRINDYSGIANIFENYMRGQEIAERPQQLKNEREMTQAKLAQELIKQQFAKPQAEQDLRKSELANRLAEVQADYAEPTAQADLQTKNIANAISLVTQKYADQQAQADLAYKQAQSQSLKDRPLNNLGVGAKEELNFQQFLGQDNPTFTPDQIYEASNVIRQGGNTLSDGTPIAPLSPAAQGSLDRLAGYSTTSSAINNNVTLKQRHAELKVLSDFARKGMSEYGTTYFGYSPKQILDSFKKDDASQKRLGKLIASQQLAFDVANASVGVAGNQPGVQITNELIKSGKQTINTLYPKLSDAARAEANRYFQEALDAGVNARLSVPINKGSVANYGQQQQSIQPTESDPLGLGL